MTINEAASILLGMDDIYILTHERPDGDTIGSAAALCAGMRALGKTAFVLPNPELTPRYRGYVDSYHAPADMPPTGSSLVVVDTAAPGRLPKQHRMLAESVVLSIDHHPGGDPPGLHRCVLPEMASTGEIIFEVLQALDVPLTSEIALPLYMAVSTDTGCFRFANTTARTHRIAAALLGTGIDFHTINRDMFEAKSRRRFQIEAMMVDGMEFFSGDTIAFCYITLDMLQKTGATEDDIDNISALPRQIEGVGVGVVIREQPDARCKISMRTSGAVEAHRICAALGGGGHARAAGCEINGSMSMARQAVLDAIRRVS